MLSEPSSFPNLPAILLSWSTITSDNLPIPSSTLSIVVTLSLKYKSTYENLVLLSWTPTIFLSLSFKNTYTPGSYKYFAMSFGTFILIKYKLSPICSVLRMSHKISFLSSIGDILLWFSKF